MIWVADLEDKDYQVQPGWLRGVAGDLKDRISTERTSQLGDEQPRDDH